jgi:hypothetical protein
MACANPFKAVGVVSGINTVTLMLTEEEYDLARSALSFTACCIRGERVDKDLDDVDRMLSAFGLMQEGDTSWLPNKRGQALLRLSDRLNP